MGSDQAIVQFLKQAGITLNGPNPYDIKLHDASLFSKMKVQGSLAAGEGYMEGLWDCDRLDELFFRLCRYQVDAKIQGKWKNAAIALMNRLVNMQTRARSLMVAEKHYNLGNDLYRAMLGETMAYTCAYWKEAETLDQAQYDKFDLVCRKVGLEKGDRVLELGCGWGTFAKYAAENYGCEIVAVNISIEQVKYARESCKGLPVQFYQCDYRDSHQYNPHGERFDKVVSIGLCEHVGAKNYRNFIKLARDNLKEEGLFLLHTIGKNYTSCVVDPWISKYIFPNGMLPSIKQLSGAMEGLFVVEDLHNFGSDYDKTLMAWHSNFNAGWGKLKGQYDETFFRLWNYYLLSCAGAFRARTMQLWQWVLSPHGAADGYNSVR